jgi:hypothetical protein
VPQQLKRDASGFSPEEEADPEEVVVYCHE